MTRSEHRLLYALAWMCEQYIKDGDGDWLNHQCMHAGECAVEVLAEFGLLEESFRGGTWTEAGLAMLNADPSRL